MGRQLGKLTALAVSRAKDRGYLADGGGLYLQVSASGARSWVFRFRKDGHLREMGLGPVNALKLADARQRATECRKQRSLGFDPIEVRNSQAAQAKLEAARALTFRQCAQAFIDAHRASWKNATHAAQWPSSLETYAYPSIGDLSVQAIDVSLVRKVLDPIWQTKTETASRLRGRMETVLDWATVAGYRKGDNPARWRGHLDKMLPARAKIQKVQHHAALPYAETGLFLSTVRAQVSISAPALEFLILTASRTSEVLGATWGEIELGSAVWTIPAARMKGGREHRVPLSKPALGVLAQMQKARPDSQSVHYIFPGARANRPLSKVALLKVLERLGRSDLTVHGFRSTFRDWAAEQTNFPRDVCEQSLAHALSDKVEAAYRRSDLFEKRRKLIEAWGSYCARPAQVGQVIAIRSEQRKRS